MGLPFDAILNYDKFALININDNFFLFNEDYISDFFRKSIQIKNKLIQLEIPLPLDRNNILELTAFSSFDTFYHLKGEDFSTLYTCLLYTSPSPRD